MSQDKNFVSTSGLLSQNGRRVLVTGAASGIGKAMALRFADAGADRLLLDIDAPDYKAWHQSFRAKALVSPLPRWI